MSAMIEEYDEFAQDTQKNKYLTFSLDREAFGIEIKYVTEIVGLQDITEVPELPEYIKGIINLRGKIIPLMDARLRFKKQPKPYDDRTCIIIIDIDKISIGLIVDMVSDVMNIAEQDIVPPPEVGVDFGKRFIKGVGKVGDDVKLLLECKNLLTQEDIEELEKAE